MKYERTKELEIFIKDNKLFDNFKSLHEIYVGGSSYNFCVQTADKMYLLKVTRNVDRYDRLKPILKSLGMLTDLAVEEFAETEKLLAMPWIEGHKLSLNDISTVFLVLLNEQYQKIQRLDTTVITALPERRLENMVKETAVWLEKENGFMYRLIKKYFWIPMLTELVSLPEAKTLIHGDMTANNILIDGGGKPHLLDFDQVRFGYAAEDYISLLLQVSGFRGLYGSTAKFAKLLKSVSDNMIFKPNELLYGVQCFYVYLLWRRLHNSSAKKENTRKTLCLLICLLGYFRVRKLIKG